ncbi:MAG TPA: hypothetical protein VGW38_19090, partial [Chloroflexota bacterium]|nr:hypothetical protein [Chloroflexota bacterium]
MLRTLARAAARAASMIGQRRRPLAHGTGAVGALVLLSGTGCQATSPLAGPVPFSPCAHGMGAAAQAWNGLDLTFETHEAVIGQRRWRYRRNNGGQWRLEIVHGYGAGNVFLFDGRASAVYNAEQDLLELHPATSNLSPSYVLTPGRACLLLDPAHWTVVGQTQLHGF